MRKIFGTTRSQQATVRRIKKLRNKHHGVRRSFEKIAALLNDQLTEHVPPAGGVWHASTVRVIAQRDIEISGTSSVKKVGLDDSDHLTVRQAAECFWMAQALYQYGSCYGRRRDRRRGAIVLVLMLTGIRRAEICSLKYRDLPVCHGKNSITVTGKGNKRQSVRISVFTRNLLDELARSRGMRRSEGSLLFTNESGGKYDPRSIWTIIKGFGRMVELQFLHPHVFRHTYASILLWNGCDIAFVKNQLRHSNIATTDVYTQVISERLSANPPAYITGFLEAINPKTEVNADIL